MKKNKLSEQRIQDEPGIQDATASDFLLPLLGVPSFAKAAPEAIAGLKGLGEAGELTLGKMAPKMGEDVLGATTRDLNMPKVEAFVKGIQKGAKGSPEVKIWGVRGDPSEIEKLGFGKDPGSIPEKILRDKGILPENINMTTNSPNSYADGGYVERLKKMVKSDKSDSQKADEVDSVGTSSGTAKGYAEGGDVDASQLPEPEMDWKDKLAKVLQAMTNSPAAKLAGAAMDPMGTTMRMGAAAAPEILKTELPVIQKVASPMTGGLVPPPPPTPAPTPEPAPQAAPAAAPVQQAPTAPMAAAPTSRPPAMDLLQKLTDGDSAKMAALMEHLKSQDKRSAFAQALGVIGDTFGNIGLAKAGMRPEELNTAGKLAAMNKESKEGQIKDLTTSLAADPNSQTSKMAQMALMQAMGIKQGDPRSIPIMKMPAQAISSMMPQLNEAVKVSVEKEKNLIEAGKADTENVNKNRELDIQQQNADKALEAAQTTASVDVIKNTSPMRDLWPGEGPRDVAFARLKHNIGMAPANTSQTMTATNKMGHRIQSTDGGHTWHPVQ